MATLIVDQKSGPYYTIQGAVADATAFDRVLVNNGTYQENVTIDSRRDNITIRVNGDAVILDGTNLQQLPGFRIEANYVTICGFSIRNFTVGIYITGSYNNITRNTITDIDYNSIRIDRIEKKASESDPFDGMNNIILNQLSLSGSTVENKSVIYVTGRHQNNILRNNITVPSNSVGYYDTSSAMNNISSNVINLLDETTSIPFNILNSFSTTVSRNIISPNPK